MKYHGYQTHVVIPDGVLKIDKKAFIRRKEYIESLVISEGVEEIGEGFLLNFPKLTAVTLPGSLYSIAKSAFQGCENLKNLTLADGIKRIGEKAFYGCVKLNCVTLPNSISHIGTEAFEGCTELSLITFPDGMVTIGLNAFRKTQWYTDMPDGLVYAGRVLYACKGTCPYDVFIQPGTVAVRNGAFYFCLDLKYVTIPDSVQYIGDYAFYNCQNLRSVIMSGAVREIGSNAFRNCINLENISFPYGVQHIGEFAFSGCRKLQKVTIPDSVTKIGQLAFYGIPHLIIHGKNGSAGKRYAREHHVPFDEEKLFVVENGVLTACGGLPFHCIIPDSVTEIAESAFCGCDELLSVIIPGSVKKIPQNLFKGIESLQSVTLSEGVTEIGFCAFGECKKLQRIDIPESMSKIGSQAFSDCECLQRITIPAAVTEIGREAFWNCSSLTAFDVEEDNGRYASEGGVLYDKSKTKLLRYPPARRQKTFSIPARVTEIAPGAFQGGRFLKHVKIPGSVKILDRTFEWCEALESAVLCSGVTTIGSSAFYDCTRLKKVSIPDSVKEIDGRAFYGCDLKRVYIPASVQSIGKEAFGYYFTFHKYKNEGFTIFGRLGSAAEQYASENGFIFIGFI